MIGAGQYVHQLTIGSFVQRVMFEQPAYSLFGFSQMASAFLKGSQSFQGCPHLYLELVALLE